MIDRLFRAETFRTLFWLALTGAATMALMPQPPDLPAGDKLQHMLAFAVLSALANLGFPEAAKARIVERLCFFGAGIEVIQSIPALNRDCDVLDWIADTIAVAVVTAGFAAWRAWRARRG